MLEDANEVIEWVEYDRFEMLNIQPKEDLELLIKQFGKMDIQTTGMLKIISGKDTRIKAHFIQLL